MPEISIIIPIYNVEKYLGKCIDSVISQTMDSIEIILVDDGSCDRSKDICDFYEKKDTRIRVIHKENGGLVSARKAGLKIATGKYVGFVDGDDWIEPNMYQYMYEKIEKFKVAMVETGVIDSDFTEEKIRVNKIEEGCYKKVRFEKEIVPRLIYNGNFYEYGVNTPYTCNKLFIRTVFMKCYQKVDNSGSMFEDLASVYPYLIKTKSVYVSREAFYHYRVVPNSVKRTAIKEPMNVLLQHLKVLNRTIQQSEYSNILQGQLKYFILYFMLLFCMHTFDTNERKLIPYGGVHSTDKIILYGAGVMGLNLYNYIENYTNLNVIQWVDRNYKNIKGNFVIEPPENINVNGTEKIVISVLSNKAVKSIKCDLINNGIHRDRIIWIEKRYIDNPELLLRKINELEEIIE